MQYSKRVSRYSLALIGLFTLAVQADDSNQASRMRDLPKGCAVPSTIQETCFSGETGKLYEASLQSLAQGRDEFAINTRASELQGSVVLSSELRAKGCSASEEISLNTPSAVAVEKAVSWALASLTQTKPKFRYYATELTDSVRDGYQFAVGKTERAQDTLIIRVAFGSCDVLKDEFFKFALKKQLF